MKLPERWNAYSAVGDVIPGTRFIAFKVPLKNEFFNEDFEGERFTPADLVERLGDKISLVIDLSKKAVGGYYSPKEIEEHGLEYQKLAVAGKQVPSEGISQRFADIVRYFEANHPPDKFIGIHCTHGVNRTGYLITKYMVQHLQFTAEDALEAFQTGRGYPLERENYIAALKKFEKSGGCHQGDHSWRNRAAPGRSQHGEWAEDDPKMGDGGWREQPRRPAHRGPGAQHRGPFSNGCHPAHHPPSRADLSKNWREEMPQENGGMWGRSSNQGPYPIPGGGGRHRDSSSWSSGFGNYSMGRVPNQSSGYNPAAHYSPSYSNHGNRPHSFQDEPHHLQGGWKDENSSELNGQWQQVHHKRSSKRGRTAHRVNHSGQRGRSDWSGGRDGGAPTGGQSQYRWTKEGNNGKKRGDKKHLHFG